MKAKSKNVIITGGTVGFGKALAEKFLSEGANISICSRNEQQLFDTQSELLSNFQIRLFLLRNVMYLLKKMLKNLLRILLIHLKPFMF